LTRSPLPEITLTCGNGHPFTTRAAGGQTVRCKECGKSKHVPTDRPRTAKEAASYAAPAVDGHQDQDPAADAEPDPSRELADRWKLEASWSGSITQAPGRANDECAECEGPLSWEPRRTLVFCPECKSIDLPPAVSAHYAREQAQRATVAVRQSGAVADPAAERKERVRFQALKKRKIEQLEEDWIETLGNPDAYDRSQWQTEARDFAATLHEWIRELKDADTEAELNAIWQDMFAEVIQSQPGKELRAEYDASLNRAEQAEQRRRYAEQMAEYEAEREAEEAAEAERQRKEAIAARQVATPRAITTGTKQVTTPTVTQLIIQAQQQRERALKQRGECMFKHRLGPKPADRLYWVPQRDWQGNEHGYAVPNTPQMRACSKHFAALEAEMTRQGYPDQVWRDLNAT
jgi:hypothetical protein